MKGKKKRTLIFDKKGVEVFSKKFKELRKKSGFTQMQLAFESGVSLSQIARIETGRINPTISTIFVIARAMEIEPEEFFKFKLK
ncbi:MAG: transcriptional regulator [Bacteroidetes bacterium RIFCSPLOWO2_12_FULL_31_6]|nr:MAG: transcriptional regulator [Bacteroidetes bacterium RIFCSPLOWO2_12_FULL_31_6]